MDNFRQTLTRDEALDLFDYNPATGILIRKRSKQGVRTLGPAGYSNGVGYLMITVNYNKYLIHRLVWLMYYGSWPLELIDHINRVRMDNRICNLRAATYSQNLYNAKASRDGLKGVYLDKRRNKWIARVRVNKRTLFLGQFATEVEAHAVYMKGARQFYGDFARAA